MALGTGESNKLMRPWQSRPGRNETVPVVTLEGLWSTRRELIAPHSRVDILAIDAEGSEALILSGALPEPLASLILFEHIHLSAGDRRAIHENLLRHGYTHLKDMKNMDPRGSHSKPANRLYGRASRGTRGAGMEPAVSVTLTERDISTRKAPVSAGHDQERSSGGGVLTQQLVSAVAADAVGLSCGSRSGSDNEGWTEWCCPKACGRCGGEGCLTRAPGVQCCLSNSTRAAQRENRGGA
jgi:hypothetical protein